ncbi:hypothetical protein HMSSN036_63990 [Paenibacillus macerans]|nr:hypothetical protein HMSSN036_63990 [Paenibacillus macerans]
MVNAAIRAKTHRFMHKHFSAESMDYRQIIALIIPILIDQAFIVGLNLVNTAMISSSGVAAVSAVNMVDSLNIFLINVFCRRRDRGHRRGGAVQRKPERSNGVQIGGRLGLLGILLALAISLLIILLHNPTLNLLFGSAEADVFSNAKTYLIGSSVSFCGIAIVEAVCGVLRGIGRSRASLFLSLIMNLSYVLLNFVFINLADLGVFGMTIAVNVSRYLAAACAIYYLVRVDAALHIRIRDMLMANWGMLKKSCPSACRLPRSRCFLTAGRF